MTDLALKLALFSGFVTALALQGDRGAQRPAVASEPVAAKFPEASGPSAPRAAPQTPSKASLGRPRPVESVTQPTGSSWPLHPAVPSHPGLPAEAPETSQDLAASDFAVEVARLSAEADGVDRFWQVYKAECGVRVGRQYDFGREWFSIWDRAAEATIDAPACSEALWRVLQAGENVRHDLLRARATAQRAVLDPGTEIGTLRWHALQWP